MFLINVIAFLIFISWVTENEWNNIIIGNYNDALLNTRIHYNSTEILPPETDVDCIMSTFAALFGDQSININVPITFIFDAQTSENTDAMGTLDFVIWAKDASGNVTSALQVQGTNVSVSDKIMNAYKVTNGKMMINFSFLLCAQVNILSMQG